MSFRQNMHPQHSKMEIDVLIALNNRGYFPCTDKTFCLLTTKPDYYFPTENLAVYLDGEAVHRKRQHKDTYLRELLEKRYHVRVLVIPYSVRSKKVRQQITAQIIETLKQK